MLARAFEGLSLAKEAQATPLRDVFLRQPGQRANLAGWDELAHLVFPGRMQEIEITPIRTASDEDGQPNPAELQIKLHEVSLKEHPHGLRGAIACQAMALHSRRQTHGSDIQLAPQDHIIPGLNQRSKEVSRRAVGLGFTVCPVHQAEPGGQGAKQAIPRVSADHSIA